jgi:hypothetical protein
MRILAATFVLMAGCASIRVEHVNNAALVTSTLALICDGMQTLSTAGNGWTLRDGSAAVEGNPIMGDRPSVAVVGGYFIGAIAINAIAWAVTPRRDRAPLPVVVTAVQARQIVDNSSRAGVCGI